MKIVLIQFVFIAALLVSFEGIAQYGYGGYGGGYGYGRGYSSRSQFPDTPRKPLTPDKIAEEQTKWMDKKLKLTDEQSLSVETANLDYALRLNDYQEAFMKSHATTRPSPQEIQQVRTTVEKWQAERETKFQSILTPEQWEIYQKKKKSMPHTSG